MLEDINVLWCGVYLLSFETNVSLLSAERWTGQKKDLEVMNRILIILCLENVGVCT